MLSAVGGARLLGDALGQVTDNDFGVMYASQLQKSVRLN